VHVSKARIEGMANVYNRSNVAAATGVSMRCAEPAGLFRFLIVHERRLKCGAQLDW
jgi:hypothetical protein